MLKIGEIYRVCGIADKYSYTAPGMIVTLSQKLYKTYVRVLLHHDNRYHNIDSDDLEPIETEKCTLKQVFRILETAIRKGRLYPIDDLLYKYRNSSLTIKDKGSLIRIVYDISLKGTWFPSMKARQMLHTLNYKYLKQSSCLQYLLLVEK